MAAIEQQQEIWRDRRRAINNYADTIQALRNIVTEMTTVLAAEKAKREADRAAFEEKKRADDELRAKPLVVGDRVRLRTDDPWRPTLGTITQAWETGASVNWVNVFFDVGDRNFTPRDDLVRVIPDDRGYEIPENVETKLAEERQYQLRWRKTAVGDRVTDKVDLGDTGYGAGTVIDVDEDTQRTIQFDCGKLIKGFFRLMCLLPGDPDFVPAPSTQWAVP